VTQKVISHGWSLQTVHGRGFNDGSKGCEMCADYKCESLMQILDGVRYATRWDPKRGGIVQIWDCHAFRQRKHQKH